VISDTSIFILFIFIYSKVLYTRFKTTDLRVSQRERLICRERLTSIAERDLRVEKDLRVSQKERETYAQRKTYT